MQLEDKIKELEESVNRLKEELTKIEERDDGKENLILKTQYENARFLLEKEQDTLNAIKELIKME